MKILTVSQLTQTIKQLIYSEPLLQSVRVQGEISNFKHHSSGHMFFTLKDEESCLQCVMFRSHAVHLDFKPEDGMTVVAAGRVDVYEVRGQYQLYVQEIIPAGTGDLYLAFEELKSRLAGEGLFLREHKKEIPFLPRRVGVVTSPTGAAIRDILTVLRRRFAGVEIILAPAQVQGKGAAETIARGIHNLNSLPGGVDVIIVGRGGGSLEELWAFNEEIVARAIFGSRVPVISAVGHETDFTIADFVADRRAPTPSAAAELAVPRLDELENLLANYAQRLHGALRRHLQRSRERLSALAGAYVLRYPEQIIDSRQVRLVEAMDRMAVTMRERVSGIRSTVAQLSGKLDGLSPLGTLERGYSICQDEETHCVIKSYADVYRGQRLRVLLRNGEFKCWATSDGRPRDMLKKHLFLTKKTDAG